MGDWVFLKLQPYKKMSLATQKKLQTLSLILWLILDFRKDRKGCIQARFAFIFSIGSSVPCLGSQEENWGRENGFQRFANFE